MNLAEAITQYLTDNPGQKGREVAAALGVNKHEVNSTLYQLEGSHFRHDAEFRWESLFVVPVQAVTDEVAETKHNGNRTEILRARRELHRLKRGVPPTWSGED